MEKLDSQLNLVGFLWLSNYRVIWRQDITSSSNVLNFFFNFFLIIHFIFI